MKIDFVSDIACPWCAVGLNALETALARLEQPVALHFQPFELNPKMPPEGQDIFEHLAQKYGASREQTLHNQQVLRERGAAVGFEFGVGKRTRTYNTFDAHRLLHWAGVEGAPGQQRALKHGLLGAYFTHGDNPSDPAVLVRVAVSVGLDEGRARALLAGDDYAAEVREREHHFLGLGIHSVPSVIVDDRHLIQGGQPPEVFEQALRQIAAQA